MHWPQRSRARVIALAALAGLALAACGSSAKKTTGPSSSGGATYALAFVGPLTGPNANLGINPRNGAQIAVDDENKAGGKFVLKSFDTQGDPAQAPTVKDKYINDNQVLGVVGPTFSGETKAVLKAYDDAGLVMISPSATAVDIPSKVPGGKSFHRIVPDDDTQGKGISQWVQKTLKAKTVFYVNDNSDYGKGLADGTQKILEGVGVQTVGTDVVDPKSQDFSAAVNHVKAASPAADAVFYGGYYAEAGRLAKQLRDAGVTQPFFVSGDGSLDPGLIVSAGAAGADNAQLTCACKFATVDAGGALGAFAQEYQAKFGKAPGTYSTEGYDAAKMLMEGIKAGNTTRAKLRDFINGQASYTGLSKAISFQQNGNIQSADVFVYTVKAGKITLLGSIAQLTASA